MVPNLICEHCGVTAFVTRGPFGPSACPNCGRKPGDLPAEEPEQVIANSLELLRDLLEIDVALLSEVSGGREVVRHAAGSWPSVEDLRGASLPLDETFCRHLLEGRIDHLIADVASDERVRDLQMARSLGVGAWMGTLIRLSDARLYVLCCLAREARPTLGERDVRVLEGFRRSMHDQLEQLER